MELARRVTMRLTASCSPVVWDRRFQAHGVGFTPAAALPARVVLDLRQRGHAFDSEDDADRDVSLSQFDHALAKTARAAWMFPVAFQHSRGGWLPMSQSADAPTR